MVVESMVEGSNIVVDSVVFSNNQGRNGGGLQLSNGVLTVVGSLFTGGNATNAAGIRVEGSSAQVLDTTFLNNTATNYGGGMLFDGYDTAENQLVILSTTFSGNNASQGGGGYLINTNTSTIANSTFSSNTANIGGGMVNTNLSVLTMTNNTFSDNSASMRGGGIANTGGMKLVNNILANSPAGSDCMTSRIADHHSQNNVIETGNCPAATTSDPMLGALGNFGGPTQTFSLQPGSPAIDAGNTGSCADPPVNNLDQRGITRPLDGNGDGQAICDIGSFEAPQIALSSITSITSDNPDPSRLGQTIRVDYSVVASVQGSGIPTGDVTVSDGVDFVRVR